MNILKQLYTSCALQCSFFWEDTNVYERISYIMYHELIKRFTLTEYLLQKLIWANPTQSHNLRKHVTVMLSLFLGNEHCQQNLNLKITCSYWTTQIIYYPQSAAISNILFFLQSFSNAIPTKTLGGCQWQYWRCCNSIVSHYIAICSGCRIDSWPRFQLFFTRCPR
jgi:hypothetical protein